MSDRIKYIPNFIVLISVVLVKERTHNPKSKLQNLCSELLCYLGLF